MGSSPRGKAELIVRLTQYLSDEEARAVEAAVPGPGRAADPGRAALGAGPGRVMEGRAGRRRNSGRAGGGERRPRVERWAEGLGQTPR